MENKLPTGRLLLTLLGSRGHRNIQTLCDINVLAIGGGVGRG